MMFMLLSIALAVTVVALLLPPLLSKKTKSAYVERDAVNVEVVTSHLNDLKQELERKRSIKNDPKELFIVNP